MKKYVTSIHKQYKNLYSINSVSIKANQTNQQIN